MNADAIALVVGSIVLGFLLIMAAVTVAVIWTRKAPDDARSDEAAETVEERVRRGL